MTLQEAFDRTYTQLNAAHIPAARLDAEYLVAEAAKIPRLRLVLEKTTPLSSEAEQRLTQWTRLRLERQPLSYVLGEQPFMHLNLQVNSSVLVPRPETELLVEEANLFLDSCENATVIDVGTGSGNIAISLAKHTHVATVHAIDISPAALSVARENALKHAPLKPMKWHLGNLLAPLIEAGVKADLIVANLPYIRTDELAGLSPEVHCEPVLALDGGVDGLSCIAPVIQQAADVLNPNGLLLLEIGADQGSAVLNLLKSQELWMDAMLQHDLAGLPRIIRATKGASVGSIND